MLRVQLKMMENDVAVVDPGAESNDGKQLLVQERATKSKYWGPCHMCVSLNVTPMI